MWIDRSQSKYEQFIMFYSIEL